MSSQTVFWIKGSKNNSVDLLLQQSNAGASAGDPIKNLKAGSSGLTCYYRRGATGALTQISLVTAAVSAYTTGGFLQLSSVTAPGVYRLDVPDAVVSAGVDHANIVINGASALATHMVHIDLKGGPLSQPTALPAWGSATLEDMMAYVFARHVNKTYQDGTGQSVFTYNNSAVISSAKVSTNASSVTRHRFV